MKTYASFLICCGALVAITGCGTEKPAGGPDTRTPTAVDAPRHQKVADGYVFTVSEEVARGIPEGSDYAVTLVQLDAQKDATEADVKQALADSSRRTTLEGKATKDAANRIKVATGSTVAIDLNRPYASFWGLTDGRLQDILADRPSEGGSCGQCYGVEGFREVKCTDPNSIVCCVAC